MIIMFDYDGTIHESSSTYIPAFRKTCAYLDELGYEGARREFSDDEIGYWLGFSAADMWNQFAPDLDDELKTRCSKMIGEEMRRLTRGGQARLYPGVEDALAQLKSEGHHLLFVSNCHHSYMQMHSDAFDLPRYFDGFYCCEDYGWPPKAELFPSIAEDWGSGKDPRDEFIMVGDRFHDHELARQHGLPFVGCAYGFGSAEELEGSAVIVDDPHDLLAAIESLCR